MSFAEMVELVRAARESGSPVGVMLGAHGNREAGMTWSHVCVAELMRLGWVEQALDLHPKAPLVTACALIDVLPPLCTVPSATSGPVIYTLSPDLLPRFEGKGTWIVAGMNGSDAALPEAASYWVRQFDQPVPGHASIVIVDGFDAESFFACLLDNLDEFPPRAVLTTPSKPQCAINGKQTPAQQLHSMLDHYSRQASKRVDEMFRDLLTSYSQSKPISDVFAWADRIERTTELRSRLRGPESSSSVAPLLAGLADNQSPRIADGLLERAERLYRTVMGAEHAEYSFPQIASILCQRAKLHSGEAAENRYEEADRLMARAKYGTKAGEVYHLKSWSEMLADWADCQSGEVEATVLFETALEKLEKALAVTPDKIHARQSDDAPLHGLYVAMVERRARRLGTAMPTRYFDAARQHCQSLIDSKESWRGYFALGKIEVYQTRTESPENFQRAMELAPQHKVAFLSDWGTALMESGLLAEAYAKFTEAAALDEKAFIPQTNMSALRLRQARLGEPTLDEAVHHAEKAESLKPGTGAYNIACAAGQRGDRAGVEKWLNASAEKGYLQNRQAVATDADFQSVASEPWFTELLDRLYP